ncbi:TPA: hypothetical protein ACIRJ4_001647 [Streptococcus suis]|uniref:Uncharacterized protein n=2 Tax=Streptococcus suis TaxID=1307 RepID=A0A4V0EX40_STRSU|nr:MULTISPECIES: hypothetical protein [Bacteria]ABP89021.1 hypothetical protein SSU05_0049 [Streptococcus suis 05ZYH33]ABP91208.1 hypothetical protein SSU98_0048 [Streptococcus suis 98HAH33]MCY0530097.1 hypothetical protein [Klebsiella pneumoniae]ADE30509.1 hypothetical protein SSGZ1_0044 [Streptococcus suis GZ1]ADV69158.1 hypothetical protein SSUJS14_0046 [Streptococcus suis JS14]
MKQTTYTLSLGGSDRENSRVSKMEEKFEKYMEGIAERLQQSGKKRIDKWFVHVRIEE